MTITSSAKSAKKAGNPASVQPSRDIRDLLEIMRRLRDPETGCPWDKVQTFASVAPSTIEEAYEVSSAIDEYDASNGKNPAHLTEELGDLLFQVVFHSRIGEERGQFDFGDVVEAITAKMIHRHPHVFGGDVKPATAEAQTEAWEKLKKRDRAAQKMSILDDVASALPALTRAWKLQKRAANVGFDWHSPDKVVEKLTEEAQEVVDACKADEPPERIEEEIGDLLFVVANLARHLKVDPEQALRKANKKFARRFNYIEDSLKAQNKPLNAATLDEMEALWQAAKAAEHTSRE